MYIIKLSNYMLNSSRNVLNIILELNIKIQNLTWN